MKPKAYSYLRMSTDLQLKGDSRRRQLEASRAYADAEGLELADDAQLEDIGISAFKGANVQTGALGQFLAAVKAGSVERGSYLLVESLDRLSREEILPAHTLFLGIVQSGINLVTLADSLFGRHGIGSEVRDFLMSFACENKLSRVSQSFCPCEPGRRILGPSKIRLTEGFSFGRRQRLPLIFRPLGRGLSSRGAPKGIQEGRPDLSWQTEAAEGQCSDFPSALGIASTIIFAVLGISSDEPTRPEVLKVDTASISLVSTTSL